MYIRYDDMDMIEFFENEPITIGEEGEGMLIYTLKDGTSLGLTLTVDAYAKTIDIGIAYNKDIIFSGEFENIIEIKKSENDLVLCKEGGSRILLKKYPCLGAIIEKE
ncbi:hypothetical protein SAMN05660668_02833 [Pseudobutyrivibrio sp. AR14]|uniref:hypothetical protein n=1 Tax=Pseudobutyrivibrio sp. AR14 TaxID=1520804 RepID=UPI000889D692|nr:hypothetical protein [Pseudobutyrivibrio sp. AR14]SCY49527.1 hypothetical protein SAMN05660668_02833 [Pseudobutyrivibrio sp. AR14]